MVLCNKIESNLLRSHPNHWATSELSTLFFMLDEFVALLFSAGLMSEHGNARHPTLLEQLNLTSFMSM